MNESHTIISIGDNAFWNCSSLKKISIPGSVTSIGDNAFGTGGVIPDYSSLTIYCVENSSAHKYALYNNIPYKLGKPTTPDADQPTTPDADQPTTPDADQPTTPDADQPTDPDTKDPINPGTEVPTDPGTEDQTDPGTDQPTSSNITTTTKISLSKAVIILSANGYAYDGTSKKPTVKSVTLNGKTLKSGTDYTVSYTNNTNIGTATVTITGKGNYTGTADKTFQITAKKGSTFTVGANKYKITSSRAAAFNGVVSDKTKKVTIPKTVTIGGKSFKVTSVAANALKGKKVTGVTVGANVTSIGKKALANCKQLGKITIKSTKLKTVGKNAFKGIKATAKIKVPAKQLSAYKKLLKGKGQGKKVKITK